MILSARRLVVFVLVCIAAMFSLSAFPLTVQAQTEVNPQINSFAQPNVDENVPHNQHTYAQTSLIEVLSAVICQLSGIDPIDPSTPCLGVNPQTHKLGYMQSNNNSAIGGVLGGATQMISMLYIPPASSTVYLQDLSAHFGLINKAYAAAPPGGCPGGVQGAPNSPLGYGFCSLGLLLNLWQSVRNIAYFMLVLAFVLIGIGVMLRVRIDPRTVMTIQNQIPRIVICILLITFSYAIAAVMVDVMWLGTYAAINLLTQSDTGPLANQQLPGCLRQDNFSFQSTTSLLDTPIGYVNQVFKTNCQNPGGSGLLSIDGEVSDAMGGLMQQIVSNLFGSQAGNACIQPQFGLPPIKVDFGACMGDLVGFLANIVMKIIVIITVLIVLFRVWWELLKAYTFTLIYIIAAPVWIVMGLLPGRPLGFEKWLRSLFVNLAVFPATALLIVGARVLMDVFNTNVNPQNSFIPPLIGNPNMHNFGILVAFGMLLMTPTLLSMLREAMKVPGTKHGAAIGQAFNQGRAIPGMLANKQWANWTRRNAQTGRAEGTLAVAQDNATKFLVNNTVGRMGTWGKRVAARRQEKLENQWSGRGRMTDAHAGVDQAGVYRLARADGAAWAGGAKDKDGNVIPAKPVGQLNRKERRDYEKYHEQFKQKHYSGAFEREEQESSAARAKAQEDSENARWAQLLGQRQHNPQTGEGEGQAGGNAQVVNVHANEAHVTGQGKDQQPSITQAILPGIDKNASPTQQPQNATPVKTADGSGTATPAANVPPPISVNPPEPPIDPKGVLPESYVLNDMSRLGEYQRSEKNRKAMEEAIRPALAQYSWKDTPMNQISSPDKSIYIDMALKILKQLKSEGKLE